jgi:hypothetical protein
VTFEDKRRRALAMLEERGVSGWAAAPPAFRLLWRLGVQLPPPHFAGLVANAAVLTATVLPVWFLQVSTTGHGWRGWQSALWECASGAMLLGVAWALAYRGQADKHGLPAWRDVEHDVPRPSGSILGLPR